MWLVWYVATIGTLRALSLLPSLAPMKAHEDWTPDRAEFGAQTLRAAIERGREYCPTSVSTAPCTKRPVLNYTRPE
jgi:hypothetical protein